MIYREKEAFWANAFSDLASEGWIYPWMGNPLDDYNPIFTAWCPAELRGLRIIQDTTDECYIEPNCWMDTFGDPRYDDVVNELVIACARLPASEELAIEIMTNWIRHGTIPGDNAV